VPEDPVTGSLNASLAQWLIGSGQAPDRYVAAQGTRLGRAGRVSIEREISAEGAVIWVGGMFFAYMALRPAAASLLEPAQRLPLWQETFRRFFFWVWLCVLGLLLSGLWMILLLGGFRAVSPHVHLMFLIGVVMIAILRIFTLRRIGG